MHLPTREIRIEPSTLCNYNCRMCARGALSRKRQAMPDSLFDRLVDQVRSELPHIDYCTLSGFGEPATDPGWSHKLRLAASRFSHVHVVTNLSLIQGAGLDELAACATDIRVSLGATTEEVYHRVHRPPKGVHLAAVEDRIRALASRPGRRYNLRLTCCRLQENEAELPIWIERWSGVADELEVWEPHNWATARSFRDVSRDREPTCGRPASGPIQVQVDGTVNVCCFDYDGVLLIGDLRVQSFGEIFGGDAMQRIRALHATGRADELWPCSRCDQRERQETRRRHLLYCNWQPAEQRVVRTSSGGEPLLGPAGRGPEGR